MLAVWFGKEPILTLFGQVANATDERSEPVRIAASLPVTSLIRPQRLSVLYEYAASSSFGFLTPACRADRKPRRTCSDFAVRTPGILRKD
jgi:hypothetical protein